MISGWLKYSVLLFLLNWNYVCCAKLSIPTRDFSLRVPQAKPSQPETYVSYQMINKPTVFLV